MRIWATRYLAPCFSQMWYNFLVISMMQRGKDSIKAYVYNHHSGLSSSDTVWNPKTTLPLERSQKLFWGFCEWEQKQPVHLQVRKHITYAWWIFTDSRWLQHTQLQPEELFSRAAANINWNLMTLVTPGIPQWLFHISLVGITQCLIFHPAGWRQI